MKLTEFIGFLWVFPKYSNDISGSMDNYRVTLTAFSIGNIAGTMFFTALLIYALNISSDNFYYSLLVGIPLIVSTIMSYGWGGISDYIGKRREVIGITGAFGGILFFVYPFVDTYPNLIILRTVQIFFMSSGILMLVIATEHSPTKKGAGLGWVNVGGSIGGVIGGLSYSFYAGSVGSEWAHGNWLIFFCICGSLQIFASMLFLVGKEVKVKSKPFNIKKLFAFGDIKNIEKVCVISILLLTGNHIIFIYLPKYLLDENYLALPGIYFGYILSLGAVLAIVCSYIAGKFSDDFGRRPILIGTIISYIITAILYITIENPILLGIVFAIPIFVFFSTSTRAMVSDLTSESERGRGLGTLEASYAIGLILGMVIATILALFLEIKVLFSFAFIFIIAALLLSINVKETSRGPIKDLRLQLKALISLKRFRFGHGH